MARYRRILGGQLHARTLPGQQAEAAFGVTILNRMIDQARPNSVRSTRSKDRSGFGASVHTSPWLTARISADALDGFRTQLFRDTSA